MTYQPRQLPPFDVLRDLYVKQGLSLSQIATKYGVSDREAVRKTMKRDAVKAGVAWPLEGVRETRGDRMRRHHGSVPAIGLRMEINEAVEVHGVTKRALAESSGVAESVVVRVSNGRQDTVTEDVRDRVLGAIQALERAASRRAVARAGLEARRRKLAREKAAGVRPLSQRDVREGRRYVA